MTAEQQHDKDRDEAPRIGSGYRDWEWAAHRLGEMMCADGPKGYYLFTPQQLVDWASSLPSRTVPETGLRSFTPEAMEALDRYQALLVTGERHGNLTIPIFHCIPNGERWAAVAVQLEEAQRFIKAVGARLGCKENESVMDKLDSVLSATQPCEGSKAYQVAHMEGKPLYVPVCGGHAEGWFTSRDHLRGGMDAECVVCAFVSTIQPSLDRELLQEAFDLFGEDAEAQETGTDAWAWKERAHWHLQGLCPRPFPEDDGTQKDCNAKGHCGCVYNTRSATGASIPYRATIKFDHETREVSGTLDLPVDTRTTPGA